MAYTFPPRGFPQQENSQQIPPNSGRPPFPPCPPPRHLFHGTPMGNPTGHGIPSFGRENLQFRPRPSPFMRFPNPRAFRPPSHRGAWTGGAGPPRQFDPRIGQVRPYRPGTQYNQFSPAFTSDITTYESWPASSCQPGRDGQQGGQGGPSHPRTGQTQRSKTNQQNSSKGGEFSNQKKHKNRRFKNRGTCSQKGQGNVAAQDLSSNDTPHYCDVCDRGFKVKELLDDHMKQHTKCSHPGCRFEAHFKVVKNHIKMQHGPGSKKVAWLDTSEEISRWREERRRNYPSAVNIAKKQEISRSNKEQGVALQNKYFGKMRQHKQGKHQLIGQTRDHGIDAKRQRINRTAHYNSIDSSEMKHQVEAASAKLTQGSLAALAVAYDESEDEVTELQQATQVTAVEGHRQDASTSRFHNQYRQKNKGKNRKTHRGTRAGKHVKERQRRQEELRRRPNLLEMLLAPDIRRERNIILQCVRYVVQNDFFEKIGEPNTTQNTESEGIFSKPCPNVTETTGTRQDYGVKDECETQVCVLTPEEADHQTSSDSKNVMNMEEKSLMSQETLAGIKEETPRATNDNIPVGVGIEENDRSKVIENPQAKSDTNELKYKGPVNNLVVLKDETPIATNNNLPVGLGVCVGIEENDRSQGIENPQAKSDTNELKYKEPVNNLVVLKDETPIATNDNLPVGLGVSVGIEENDRSQVIENPQAKSDTNELKYKEPVNNLVVLKDESSMATEDKVTSGVWREVDDLNSTE